MQKHFIKTSAVFAGSLMLYAVFAQAASDKKAAPVLLTETVAINQLVNSVPPPPVSQHLAGKKAELNEINVAQYRLSQTVSKIEGKNVALTLIPSSLDESESVLAILDSGIASLAGTPENPLDVQRHRNQVEAEAQQIYWQAFGARQVERSLNQLIDKTSQLLASTIPDKNRPPQADKDTPPVSPAQRSELLKILSELNQLLKDNRQQINELAAALKRKKGEFIALPISSNDLQIPKLAISQHMLEEQALRNVIAPLPVAALPATPPAKTGKSIKPSMPAMPVSAKKNEFQELAETSRNKIDLLTPGIAHQWSINNSFNTNNWLSSGKYLAFDVYNQLDKKQRVDNLKEAVEDSNDRPMLGAAVLARLHVAWNLYLDRLEKYQLSSCLQSMNERLVNLENSNLADSTDHIISSIRSQIANIRMTRRHYDHYAQLRSAFSLVKTSFAGNPTKMENFDRQRSCYQPLNMDTVLPPPPQPPVVKAPEPVAPVKTQPAKMMPPVLAKPDVEKNQWVMEQKDGAFTLQILTNKNRSVLTRYISRHKLDKAAHVTRMGKDNYALHYGVYRDKEMAFIAQFKLPFEVQSENQIWIRRIGDIQKNIK
jgi:hypothetical protein